jgi:hypothetical protein
MQCPQLLGAGETACIEDRGAAESARFSRAPEERQIIFVASTAPQTMAHGRQNIIKNAVKKPSKFNLKTPNVKMQAMASQITLVEIVLLSSVFIVFVAVVSPRIITIPGIRSTID